MRRLVALHLRGTYKSTVCPDAFCKTTKRKSGRDERDERRERKKRERKRERDREREERERGDRIGRQSVRVA
jgi:hypothetical protein